MNIDVTFDFRTDTPVGRDADAASPTLRKYHHLLWSRPLPSGEILQLDTSTPGSYLHHYSDLGEFWFGSDSIIHTYDYWARAAHIMADIPELEKAEFKRVAYTMGGFIVFPNNKIEGVRTLNQRRGTERSIDDRFDLTLECIRRHYVNETSPLTETIASYGDFFALFDSFCGYVDFFLLQDLVTRDYASIRWMLPFEGFVKPAMPGTTHDYLAYRERSIAFVEARNNRIRRLIVESPD
jgi:hypothetical protein